MVKKVNKMREWLLLSKLPLLGSKKCRQIVEYFGSPQKVLSASFNDIAKVPGLDKKAVLSIMQAEKIDIDNEITELNKIGVNIVGFQEPLYPSNLLTIFDPPFILYVRGKLKKEDVNAIAIVGTRRATTYGKLTARKLARELAKEGITIVSGMARGIDTAAHWGALEVGGRTIAVLGCGVDVVYPPENKRLMKEIIKNGAIISEFPLKSVPDAFHFPQRNRIISGLSKGVVIVEAPLKSGALITANFALEQGREVFAVPGNISNPNTQGTNRLIKEGAKLVETREDILEELNLLLIQKEKGEEDNLPLSAEERKIFDLLKDKPLHIDSVVKLSNLS
ncbi:MAG: DNA-processing protein DprA, partial [Candidatus Aerophobetes bacterium]|nr:DNA-processing protein DprA [Candidatus Aerophobetes bacterium]